MIIIMLVTAVIFFGLAYLVGVKKMYMLLAGFNTASPEELAKMNLPAVCRATGICFCTLAAATLICAGLLRLGFAWAIEIFMGVILLGCWFFVLFIQKYDGNNYDEQGKPQKRFYVIIIGVSLLMSAIIGGVILSEASSLREPRVSFTDSTVTLDGMYGLTIAKSDISSVTLLDTAPQITIRSNGVDTLGAKKGHFNVNGFGRVRLFVRDNSIPWIYIQGQKGKEKVLIALSNSDDTLVLYQELLAWFEEP